MHDSKLHVPSPTGCRPSPVLVSFPLYQKKTFELVQRKLLESMQISGKIHVDGGKMRLLPPQLVLDVSSS
jgi:hypothetical protein